MRLYAVIILIISTVTGTVKSDILYLKNGGQIEGQLLKITDEGLLFEVRSGLFITGYRTFPVGDVLKVIDDFQKVLYENQRLKVDYLSDYYNNPLPSLPYMHKLDTLYLADSTQKPVYITNIDDDFIFYRSSSAPPETVRKLPLLNISSISGKSVGSYRQANWFYPRERIMTYPAVGIELNCGFIGTHLSTLSKLKIDSTVTGNGSIGTRQFRRVRDDYTSIQLGLFVQINPFLSIHALGFYTPDFNRSTAEGNVPEKDESYYLAATEIHLTYPGYFIKPWAGLGYAHQSFTIISNFSEYDAVWTSQTSCFEFSAGLDINVTPTFMFTLSGRLMNFPARALFKGYNDESIDLANRTLSAGLKVLL